MPGRFRCLALLVAWCWSAALAFGVDGEGGGVGEDRNSATVVSVQFEVTEARYTSLDTYRAAVSRVLGAATRDPRVDLVVFPEYINVPALFFEYAGVLQRARSLASVLEEVLTEDPALRSTRALILDKAEEFHPRLLEMWSTLARKYQVSLIPGTFFVPHSRGNGVELRNRAVVIDDTGAVVYRQDKVYLTDFERNRLQLSPGTVDQARAVSVEGLQIGVTVCRDSYFEEWEHTFGDVDLWIDLRANGETYTPEVRARFRETLPERVAAVDARAGLNASLTGRYLDLIWEGPSYIVDAEGRRTAETPDVVGTSLLFLTMEAAPEGG